MTTKKKDGWAHTHTDRDVYHEIKLRAKHMRQNPTVAENILWRRLRRKQVGGFSFRRQHPIGRFIVDFYCAKARLVIEVDGEIHDGSEQAEYDASRQEFLEGLDLKVLRFDNAQVYQATDAVIEAIAESLYGLSEDEVRVVEGG